MAVSPSLSIGEMMHTSIRSIVNLGVSENRDTPKSSHFSRIFHYKPSILGYPYFWKHPFRFWLLPWISVVPLQQLAQSFRHDDGQDWDTESL